MPESRYFAGMIAFLLFAAASNPATAENAPGVTAAEIKIGQTMPYSGPASAYSAVGRADAAVFRMINDQGGINGRKITLISEDDGYNPAKALEQTRKMVEKDQVAFIFNTVGTPSNSAIEKYLNEHKIPQVFLASGADKFANYADFPWTIGWQPSYRVEAQIYAKYILKNKPNAKVAILYQNDDLGKDYLAGFKDALGDKYAVVVVKELSYQVADPTIDTQIITLQGTGANTLLIAATPKFAAQAIRKVHGLGWKPQEFLINVSSSAATVLEPAGVEKAIGAISAAYAKDVNDSFWNDDAGVKQWRAFMKRYLPEADISDRSYVVGYNASLSLVQVLKQCAGDLSRLNIMRQATNLKNVEIPMLLPGIRLNSSATNYRPITQWQLVRWDGMKWGRFGEILGGPQS
jgi:branched-chain amino acid transport system substrate-binding protein